MVIILVSVLVTLVLTTMNLQVNPESYTLTALGTDSIHRTLDPKP